MIANPTNRGEKRRKNLENRPVWPKISQFHPNWWLRVLPIRARKNLPKGLFRVLFLPKGDSARSRCLENKLHLGNNQAGGGRIKYEGDPRK
jgi:hypothetical protein